MQPLDDRNSHRLADSIAGEADAGSEVLVRSLRRVGAPRLCLSHPRAIAIRYERAR